MSLLRSGYLCTTALPVFWYLIACDHIRVQTMRSAIRPLYLSWVRNFPNTEHSFQSCGLFSVSSCFVSSVPTCTKILTTIWHTRLSCLLAHAYVSAQMTLPTLTTATRTVAMTILDLVLLISLWSKKPWTFVLRFTYPRRPPKAV